MKIKPTKKAGRVAMEISRRDEPMLMKSAEEAVRTPFAIKKILVPVDFSDCSKKALDYAIPFARQFGASIALLYVIPVNYPVGEFGMVDVAFMEKELREGGEKQLTELRTKQIGADVPSAGFVRVGRAVTEIADVARRENADLIIISTHGHTGLKHVLLGIVTENVVRYAPCPVLVVREHEHEFLKNLTE